MTSMSISSKRTADVGSDVIWQSVTGVEVSSPVYKMLWPTLLTKSSTLLCLFRLCNAFSTSISVSLGYVVSYRDVLES